MNEAKPKIAVLSTGGTIATTGKDTMDIANYAGEVLDGAGLLARVPEVGQVADIVVVPYSTVGSEAIGPRNWLELNRAIERCVADSGVDGVVVTHGTATLEETAYFLSLTLKVAVPVVIVGSQRPITGLSTDAPMNLVNAVRVAASPPARGLGVLTLLNDEIHAAREVTKSSVFRLQAFQAPELGVLGHADPDRVVFYRAPLRKHYPDTEFDLRGIDALPRVDIIESYAGADGIGVGAFVEAGTKGLVVASLAPGILPPGQHRALEGAQAAGVIIVYSTRAPGGRVVSLPKHQLKGSITADNLSPQKARVLLMLALTQTSDAASIQQIFDEY